MGMRREALDHEMLGQGQGCLGGLVTRIMG